MAFSGVQNEEKFGAEFFFNSEVLYGILSPLVQFNSVVEVDEYSCGLSVIFGFTLLFYIKNSNFEPYAPIRGVQAGMGQLLGYDLSISSSTTSTRSRASRTTELIRLERL